VRVTTAQDLRISLPSSSHQPQQPNQSPAVTDQHRPLSQRISSHDDSAACQPPPFGLGVIAVSPHTSFGFVPTAPTSNTVSPGGGTGLNVPTLHQSQSGTCSATIRRRVSDKTALPISTGIIVIVFVFKENSVRHKC